MIYNSSFSGRGSGVMKAGGSGIEAKSAGGKEWEAEFLDASLHFYNRVYPSVRQSVLPFVRRSVILSSKREINTFEQIIARGGKFGILASRGRS